MSEEFQHISYREGCIPPEPAGGNYWHLREPDGSTTGGSPEVIYAAIKPHLQRPLIPDSMLPLLEDRTATAYVRGYNDGVAAEDAGQNEALDALRAGIEELRNDLLRIGAISRHRVPVKGRSLIAERLTELLDPAPTQVEEE